MFGKHEVPQQSLISIWLTLKAYIFLIFLIYKFRGSSDEASMLSHSRRHLDPIHVIGCPLDAFSPLITGTKNETTNNREIL